MVAPPTGIYLPVSEIAHYCSHGGKSRSNHSHKSKPFHPKANHFTQKQTISPKSKPFHPKTSHCWHCGTVALWHCGTVALWHCGIVALWHCGHVLNSSLQPPKVLNSAHVELVPPHVELVPVNTEIVPPNDGTY